VDLERRTVADVLNSRSAQTTADWLKRYPGIDVVSRDRPASTPKASGRERRAPGRLRIAFICCKTCARTSSGK
jgi:hypothetical protein